MHSRDRAICPLPGVRGMLGDPPVARIPDSCARRPLPVTALHGRSCAQAFGFAAEHSRNQTLRLCLRMTDPGSNSKAFPEQPAVVLQQRPVDKAGFWFNKKRRFVDTSGTTLCAGSVSVLGDTAERDALDSARSTGIAAPTPAPAPDLSAPARQRSKFHIS